MSWGDDRTGRTERYPIEDVDAGYGYRSGSAGYASDRDYRDTYAGERYGERDYYGQQAPYAANNEAYADDRYAREPRQAARSRRPDSARYAPVHTEQRGTRAATTAKKPRIAALDGLRALAILSIVLYHLNVTWLPSGHMGVVMFFVLTGYLVVGSLVKSVERSGTIDLKTFWLKRFKRIWPSMAVMVVAIAAICVLFNHILLTKMRPDIIPSLLFFSNWSYILSGASYFNQIGGPSPLTHLWYLGVDAQAIVLLPLIVLLGMRVFHLGRTGLRRMLLVLAAVSAVLMMVLYNPSADPSRVYYGVDTRIFSILIGGWLACVWPLGGEPLLGGDLLLRYDQRSDEVRASVVSLGASAAALALLVIVMVFVPASSAFFYYGGMVLVSLLVVVLLVGLLAPGSLIARVFGLKPIVWLGSRSFALYLWHYPIIQLLDADAMAPWTLKLIAFVVSLAVAELTWRFIESPFSDGRAGEGLMGFITMLRSGGLHGGVADREAMGFSIPFVASAGVGALLAAIALIGCIVVPPETLVPEDAIKSTGDAVDQAVDLTAGRAQPAEGDQTAETGDAETAPFEEAPATQQVTVTDFGIPYDQMTDEQKAQVQAEIQRIAEGLNQEKQRASDEVLQLVRSRLATTGPATDIPSGSLTLYAAQEEVDAGMVEPLLVGDSVPGDTEAELVWMNTYNDSYIGRQPGQALQVLQGYLDQQVVGNVVVLASFSNSGPVPDVYDQIVEAVGEREIFLVGIVAPDVNQEAVNTALQACADKYENAHYIDWPSTCAENPSGYLWGDGEHLTPRGAAAYIDMISQEIAPYMVAEGGRAEPYTWDSSWW